MGGFYDAEFEAAVVAAYDWESVPAPLTVMVYILLTATLGMVEGTSMALGEEIGWRDFLVPELAKGHTFMKLSFISGVIWALWHYPLIIGGEYSGGGNRLYGLVFFSVMIISTSFCYS